VSVRFILFLTITTLLVGKAAGGNYLSGSMQMSAQLDSLDVGMEVPDADTSTTDILRERVIRLDSLARNMAVRDSMTLDSLDNQSANKSMLEAEVKYSAEDSMYMDLPGEKLYLYGNAKVNYQEIELIADYIELDLGREEVYARGVPDSLGKVTELPKFTQGDQTFD
jgi:hypothetical protein